MADNLLNRYLPFQRFYQMLFNGQLVLVSPRNWDDTFEQYWLNWLKTKEGKKRLDAEFEKHGMDAQARKKFLGLIKGLYNCTYCLCFSSKNDAEVLWNARSDNKQCIMFATTKEKVYRIIPDDISRTIKPVQYDMEDYGQPDSFLEKLIAYAGIVGFEDQDDLFLHKRKDFDYEQEVRLIAYAWERSYPGTSITKLGKEGLLKIQIPSIPEFIEGVMVHPSADPAFVKLVEMLCNQFGINFMGKSKVYSFKPIAADTTS